MAWKKIIERLLYRGGLRRRLLILGLTFLGVALIINTLAGTYYTGQLIKKAAGELQKGIAARVAHEIDESMDSKLQRLADFSTSASFHGLGTERQRLLALLLLKNDPAFTDLAVLNEDGHEVLKISERRVYLSNELSDQSQSEKFKKAVSGAAYISPVYTSDRAEPYVTLSVPIKLGPRQIIGVVTAETNLKTLWDVVGNIRFGRAGYAYLVDGRGNLIAHRDSSLVLKRLNLSHLREVKEFLQNPGDVDPSPSEESLGMSGELVISTYAPIQKLGWAVVLAEPVAVALDELATLQRYAGLQLGAGLLIGALIISWVSKRITNPIRTLHLGAQLIGAGNLDHRVDIKSDDEIEELAEGFNKMALELKNSYSTLEQKVEQRTREASALYDVTKTVNQSLDLDTVLQEVVKGITQMFRFDTTRIYLYDAERECLVLRAFFETHHDPWASITLFRRRRSVMSQVAESGEAAIFEDVQSDPRCAEWSEIRATRGAGFHFLAVLPIKTQAKVSGAVAFSRREKRTLSDDELRLLSTMCEHVAVAVEKANLFDEVKRRSQHLAVLNTIGTAVSRSLDLDTVLKAASEKIFDTLGFDASWIYILDPAQGELRLKAYKGLSDEMAITMDRRKTSSGVSGRIFQTGQRMVFEDMPNDPHYMAVSSKGRASSLGFITGAGFPIKAKDTIIGVLHVANKVRRHFAPEELQLIESIAQEVGVAAENARLFAEVNEKTLELAKTNQELLEATRAKSEFIAAMSHELRTPLNIVLGSSELMRDGFFGELSSAQGDAIDKISRNGRVLLKMINDVLTLSRLDAKKMSLNIATVEVEEIIAHARALVEQINRDNHLEVHWDIDQSVPPLVTDPLKLEEILHNLIGNAFKFTPKGRVEVRVCKLPDQARVQFSVADTGIGIEAADLGRIFNAFEQLREAHTGDFNGVGLGLNIVKEYLDLMQGDLRVESQPGQGSTFTFSLPCSVALNS